MAEDCQADYTAIFQDLGGTYPVGSALSSTTLLDYDAATLTLTVAGSDASLQNVYVISFTATLKSCTESGLDG